MLKFKIANILIIWQTIIKYYDIWKKYFGQSFFITNKFKTKLWDVYHLLLLSKLIK